MATHIRSAWVCKSHTLGVSVFRMGSGQSKVVRSLRAKLKSKWEGYSPSTCGGRFDCTHTPPHALHSRLASPYAHLPCTLSPHACPWCVGLSCDMGIHKHQNGQNWAFWGILGHFGRWRGHPNHLHTMTPHLAHSPFHASTTLHKHPKHANRPQQASLCIHITLKLSKN